MVADQQAPAEIEEFGEVKFFRSPPGWIWEYERPRGVSTRSAQLFHPPNSPNISFNVFIRGSRISETVATKFQQILEERLKEGASSALSEEDIRELTQVLGFNTLGDNQYTNNAPKGSTQYHVFNLQAIDAVSLNGRPALKVVGTFQEEHGIPLSEYSGYLYAASKDKTHIEDLFFQAPNQDKYHAHLADFEACLSTLEWR